jgi:cell division septation protein DedD
MRFLGILSVLFCSAALLTGCGSVEESQEEPPAPPPSAPMEQPKAPDVEFEMKTDTVDAVKRFEHAGGDSGATEVGVRYLVQVGAFKEPQNASATQIKARERFTQTVLNDFDKVTGLYQIRIGFFETRESAEAFRQKIQTEYPGEYTGSWIVTLKR